MVNNTALQKIISFIDSKNLRPMKQWSSRSRYRHDGQISTNNYNLSKQIRQLLVLISGNDVTEMIKDVLTKNEIELIQNEKYKKALIHLSENYQVTNLKERHNLIRPLKQASFKLSEIKRLGFKASRHLWKTCQNSTKRNNGGGNTIERHLEEAIQSYLHQHSSIASNRLVKNKNRRDLNYNRYIPARYLDENKIELYKKSPFKNYISKATFYKYCKINNEFKKPHRLTDMCEYCEKERFLKTRIGRGLIAINYQALDNYNFENLEKELKKRLSEINENQNQIIEELLDDVQQLQALTFHKNVANCQRNSYNDIRSNIDYLRNKVLIELDFKQKIVIPMSPRQINAEYYKLQQRSCLGFGIYYVVNDTIKTINFDIISNDLGQKAYHAIRGFRFLRQQEWFKNIDSKHYVVWCDTGKSFRCAEMIGFLFKELASHGVHVNLNFFVEKHGKNSRDSHFSNIVKFIRAQSLTKRLVSSQDIADAIMERQNMANQNKNKDDPHVITYASVFDTETAKQLESNNNCQKTFITNLESFYNYQTIGDDFKIVSSILSCIENCVVDVKHKNEPHNNENEELGEEEVCENLITSVKYETIHTKRIRIKSELEKLDKNIVTDENIDFFNYFTLNTRIDNSLEVSFDDSDSEIPKNVNFSIEKPKFCRDELEASTKKKPCKSCSSKCTLTIENLLPSSNLSRTLIEEELYNHHHPKSRVIDKRWRNTDEAKQELKQHYLYSHGF